MIIKIAKSDGSLIMFWAHMTIIMWQLIIQSEGEIDCAWDYGTMSNLHMGKRSKIIISLFHHVVVTWIVGISWLSFLRLLLIICKVLKLLSFAKIVTMGDDKNRVDPFFCDALKNKKEVWRRLQKGGITPYLERLHGNNPQATTSFVKGWNNMILKLGGNEFDVNEDFIVKITSLSMEGKKVYRDKKESKVAMHIFFKGDEEQ